ncbi:hypothetical protein JG536_12390 [Burkholderia ambifaria]|uniref:hypothetical protein n=1 Tax=Burkholderia ambifaria TaxID=152480 RepID=UPI001589BD2D|nr:hypothetical protein [Burkholderia ambifaria]QQJ96412.1 hypothetical protein JG536_12390 [Burkholderia ambifaria]
MSSKSNGSAKNSPTLNNYLLQKVTPLFIVWFGVSMAFWAAPYLGMGVTSEYIRKSFSTFTEWRVLGVVVVGGVFGYLVTYGLAGFLKNGNDIWREAYAKNFAQEIIGAILNVSIAAVYSKMFGAPWSNLVAGIFVIGGCFGAWRSYCFTR